MDINIDTYVEKIINGEVFIVQNECLKYNPTDLINKLTVHADKGNMYAQYALGMFYRIGIFYDSEKSMKLLKLAAEQGLAQAQNFLGQIYFSLSNQQEAAKLFKLAADQGDVNGLVNLAFSYNFGCGVEEDSEEALRLCKLAAEKGDSAAIAFAAELYLEKSDLINAIYWYNKLKLKPERPLQIELRIPTSKLFELTADLVAAYHEQEVLIKNEIIRQMKQITSDTYVPFHTAGVCSIIEDYL
jgi:hypothetical protein